MLFSHPTVRNTVRDTERTASISGMPVPIEVHKESGREFRLDIADIQEILRSLEMRHRSAGDCDPRAVTASTPSISPAAF